MNRTANTFLACIIFGLAALFYLYEYMLRITPSIMNADLMRAFSIDGTVFGLLSAFYYAAYVPMQVPVGVLMDRYGPRRLLAFACLVCAAGALLFAETNLLSYAIAGRVLIGFGSAFAFVGVLKIATIWFPQRWFGFLAGLASMLGSFGGFLSEISLTALNNHYGWRQTMVFTVIAGVILGLLIYFIIRDTAEPVKRTRKKESVDVRQVLSELLDMCRRPQIWIIGFVGMLLYLPVTTFAELWANPYMRQVYHFSPQLAGDATSALFLGFTVGAPLMGFFSDYIRNRRIPLIVGGFGAAIIMIIVLYIPNISTTMIFILLFVAAIFYSAQVVVFALASEISPSHATGSAIAITNMVTMLGGFIFQPLVGHLLDRGWAGQLVQGVRVYPINDYKEVLLIIPIGLLMAVFLAFFLTETHGKKLES